MSHNADEQRPLSYTELVRQNADFRWLWFGQIVSLLGDWFNLIASAALVAALTGSGLAVGSLFVVRMLAPFLMSPLAGVAADRYSRRQILIVADVLRGFIVLGLLLVRSVEWVWLLYVLNALQLGTSSFFFAARNAILPDIVEPRGLGAANAIGSVTWSVMLAVGAAIGGLIAGSVGVYAAFAVDSVTFFVSAWLVAQIRRQPGLSGQTAKTVGAAFGEYVEGLAYLYQHPDILAIASHKAALTVLVGTTFRVVQVAIAEQAYPIGRQGAITMGLLFAVAGLGSAVGPLAFRLWTGDVKSRLRQAILFGYAAGALGLIITSPLLNFGTVLLGTFMTGISNGILWVFSTQLLMQLVPSVVRGRVFGTEFAMFALASAIGSAVVGLAMDSPLGITGVTSAMAVLTSVPAVGWAWWLRCRKT